MAERPRQESVQGIREVGGFELLGKIGQGGMGSVFRARQKSLDRIVALKILPPSVAKDAKFIERFQREARASAKLNHPNIVQGIDVGQDPATGLWYFAMELVDGPSLLTVLKQQGALPEERVLRIAMDMARALQAAAKEGIVHRDIKPDNILLSSTGQAKLADLGLAKQVREDASLTQAGMALGTPFYMAPEQIRGQLDQLDQRTDLYALGGTLFHLVTGRKPFEGETGAVIMTRHLTEAAPRANKVNPNVSEAFSRLLARLLQKKKEQRVQSAGELLVLLERIEAGEDPLGPERPSRHTAGPRASVSSREAAVAERPRRPAGAVIVGGAIGVAALGLVVFLLVRGQPTETPGKKVATAIPVAPPQGLPPLEKKEAPKEPPAPARREALPPSASEKESVSSVQEPPPPPEAVPPAAAPPEPAPATKPAEVPAAVEKPAEPEPVKFADWPLVDLLADLQRHAPEKAAERVRDGQYVAKDAMLAALKVLESRRDARTAALKNLVGKDVSLETAKGPQKGKLLAFEGHELKIESTYAIDGRNQGTTRTTVALSDLTAASLERLVPTPAPVSPEDWIAATLAAMAEKRAEVAERALQNLEGHELHATLVAELTRTRTLERETQAQAAWARLLAKAEEAPSQSRAKQFNEELAAFLKKFGDSDLVASPEVAARIAELKEQFERLALGLDPRVIKLFKGRVLGYDARTQVITLGYDFSTKEQTEDFVDSTWAPPGDHTGLTWKKGELRTFCKGTADRIFRMPQFLSGALTLVFDFRKIDTLKRNRFEVEFGLYGLESEGKAPKVSYKATEKGHYLLGPKGELKSDTAQIPFRADGTLELSCQGPAIAVKENGKTIFEYQLPKPNDHVGWWLGGGWDSGITFTRLQVSGRLDPAWLAKALAALPKAR